MNPKLPTSFALPIKIPHFWEFPTDWLPCHRVREEKKRTVLGKRHVQYLLLFFGGAIAFFIRSSLSVAIVAMIDKNPPYPKIKTYPEWRNKDVILSSFYCGYVFVQIPAGLIGHKYGPKYFLVIAFTIASTFTLLAPLLAQTLGSSGMILSRAIQGLSQGFLFPSTHNILSNWTPIPERSRTFAFVYSSTIFGSTLGLPITGYICSTSYGWPAVFYISGTLGLIWSLLMFFYCHNRPEDDASISKSEKLYIEESIEGKSHESKLTIPWKRLLTSLPFWAILICNASNNYGFMTILAEIPSFMQGVLKFNIKENSQLSALPFLASFIMAFIYSPISDYLIKNKKLSITASRKLFNTFAMFTPAVAMLCLAYVPPEMKALAVSLLVLVLGSNAAALVGYNVNHVDITPNFAGISMGFCNTTAQIAAILAPLMVQVLVTDQNDPNQWRVVFMIASILYLVGSTVFLIFASGEVQDWNNEKPNVMKMDSMIEQRCGSIKKPLYQTVPLKEAEE